ncbi:MAG: hypothetical protein GY791_19375 [Alphaproteobacteria bacterium]|nr:hypothetical protein [Alphaproteobacteria bacterium]
MINKIMEKRIAKPYAEAFFQSSVLTLIKQKNLKKFFKIIFDVRTILTYLVCLDKIKISETIKIEEIIFNSNTSLTELNSFIKDPINNHEFKKILLTNCFTSVISENMMDFLIYLVNKKKIAYLSNIMEKLLELFYDFLAIKFIRVDTQVKFTFSQQKFLIKLIQKNFDSIIINNTNLKIKPKILLFVNINKTLIGGFTIQIDSKIIDLSIKTDLYNLGKLLNLSIKI